MNPTINRLLAILTVTLSISSATHTSIDDFQFGICGKPEIYPTIKASGFHYVEASTKLLTKPNLNDQAFASHLKSHLKKQYQIPVTNSFISIPLVGPKKDHSSGLKYATTVFERAKKLGVKKIVFGSQGSRTPPDHYDLQTARREFVTFLKLIVPEAQKRGLVICLEPLTKDNLMPTLASAAAMCEEINAPQTLGITADFWHMMNNNDEADNIRKFAKHIKHIHLAEQKGRTPPGINNQDLSAYWDALVASGYKGLISIEASWRSPISIKTHHARSLQVMKKDLQKAIQKSKSQTGSKITPHPEGRISSVTYNNNPLGTPQKPLILRTYLPDPGLDQQVLANHHHAGPSPKYSPAVGRDVPGTYFPINGIPAAIAVNHGKGFSYAWDTTECRLLYTWSDGFLDMHPYWGTSDQGNRTGFGYLPSLTGTMTYMAKGNHPLTLNSQPIKSPKFLGYSITNNQPTFRWKSQDTTIHTTITPSPKQNGKFTITHHTENSTVFGHANLPHTTINHPLPNHLSITISPNPNLKNQIKSTTSDSESISIKTGEKLFLKYSCQMCHTIDGGKSHGPTLQKLHGKKRKFSDTTITADETYLRESLTHPNAKIVPGYQPNYMPKFPLQESEITSLVLYLKSL